MAERWRDLDVTASSLLDATSVRDPIHMTRSRDVLINAAIGRGKPSGPGPVQPNPGGICLPQGLVELELRAQAAAAELRNSRNARTTSTTTADGGSSSTTTGIHSRPPRTPGTAASPAALMSSDRISPAAASPAAAANVSSHSAGSEPTSLSQSSGHAAASPIRPPSTDDAATVSVSTPTAQPNSPGMPCSAGAAQPSTTSTTALATSPATSKDTPASHDTAPATHTVPTQSYDDTGSAEAAAVPQESKTMEVDVNTLRIAHIHRDCDITGLIEEFANFGGVSQYQCLQASPTDDKVLLVRMGDEQMCEWIISSYDGTEEFSGRQRISVDYAIPR
eukprot:scpid82364/ scgid29197/ 